MLNDLAGIAEIELPPGFEKAAEDCDFGHYIEFRRNHARICYWQKDNFFAPPEAVSTLQECLKRRPHYIYRHNPKDPHDPKVEDAEYFAAADALLQPGRVLPPFGFDIKNLRTQVLNGKAIFRADFDARQNFTSILMWDAVAEAATLRHLWLEGPVAEESQLQQEFEQCCASIQWV
jgi:hypothetical protein